MAIAILPVGAMRRHRYLAPILGASVIGLGACILLAPSEAKAASCGTAVYTVQVTTGPLPGSYDVCAVYASYQDPSTASLNSDLTNTPWFSANNGQAIAKAVADALVTQISQNGTVPLTSDVNGALNGGGPVPTNGPQVPIDNGNGSVFGTSSALFLWKDPGNLLKATAYTTSGQIAAKYKPDPTTSYWYFIAAASPDPAHTPGPLPILGAGAAFSWSRRLRRRTLGPNRPCLSQVAVLP